MSAVDVSSDYFSLNVAFTHTGAVLINTIPSWTMCVHTVALTSTHTAALRRLHIPGKMQWVYIF